MSFNPQALNERTLKQFVDRLHALRKSQPTPSVWPPKRSAIQEEVARTLGFTSWNHAIHAVRPLVVAPIHSPLTPSQGAQEESYPGEPIRWEARDFDHFLDWAATQSASDIVFQSNEKVIIEVHGKMRRVTARPLTTDEIQQFVKKSYGDSALSLLRDAPDLEYAYMTPARSRFRVIAVSVTSGVGEVGIQVGVRAVPSAPPALAELYPDMPPDVHRAIFDKKSGIVVVSGQTSSGKTTLTSSLVRDLLVVGENRRIVEFGAPLEFEMGALPKADSNAIAQTCLSGARMTFGSALRSARRRNASDIVLELMDKETISEALSSSAAGHRLYASLFATGVSDAIDRMVRVFDASERRARHFDVLSSINVIINQALVPGVDGTRVALREVLVLDEEAKTLLIDAGHENIRTQAEKLLLSRGSDFLSDATRLCTRGVISPSTLDIYARRSKFM